MTSYSRRAIVCLLLLAMAFFDGVTSFSDAPTAFQRSVRTRASTTTSRRFLVPDPASVEHSLVAAQALQHGLDSITNLHGGFELSSTSQFLADAAEAVADAAKEGPSGFNAAWQSYLKIFENSLLAIHGAIEGPLKSVGFEQPWGVSIFLFTAAARTLLLPLSIQQSKNSEYMKALKPYVEKVSQKFKDNEDAKNRAVGKLYEDAQQNPLAGCITSLLQLPIFLGLYRGVRLLAKDGELKEPFLFLPSLEGPVSGPDFRGMDWLTQGWTTPVDGGFPVPAAGWDAILPYLIMPVVLVLLQSATMSVLTPATDTSSMSAEEKENFERSQGFIKFIPLLIGVFSLQVPAGLTIYWFTSNIFTLSSSLAVRAYFKANPPKIDLPDYWDAAFKEGSDFASMTPDERRKAVEAGIRVGPTLEQLEDEARFHCLIERNSLRAESNAWKRLASEEMAASALVMPAELEEWVKMAHTVAATSTHSTDTTSSSIDSETPFYASSGSNTTATKIAA